MTASLILWGHAIAALLFGALALDQFRRPAPGWPGAVLVAALGTTALWALATAGIDPRDLATRLAESIRNLCWLAFLAVLVRRQRAGGFALAAVYAVAIGLAALAGLLAVANTLGLPPAALKAIGDARLLARTMGAIASLVLVHHLGSTVSVRGRPQPAVIALAAIWGADLVCFLAGLIVGAWPAALVALRGFVAAAAALVLAIGLRRRGEWNVALSRSTALRSLAAAAVLGYAGITVLATWVIDRVAGDHARLVQTAVVLGACAALFALVSTPWLRAWAKVELAKHLFRHRYDYRAEWQRFTATMGVTGDDAPPLPARAVRAIADLTDSPAGTLLIAEGGALVPALAWNWALEGPASSALAEHLVATGRIIELDSVRSGKAAPIEAEAIPEWMLEQSDAWAIVPLLHADALIGAVILARPPVDRMLDWEDFDLFRVAGRQAASHLAEDRARAALADADRFDEFNRRFAFILHDIKNLVSGLTLVARNAERHADNPDFRADMVATLQDSAARMNMLLARLAPHQPPAPEAARAIDVAVIARRLADRRRAQHPVVASGGGVTFAAEAQLTQLLDHLIQNAVEASSPGVPVTIAVDVVDSRVIVDVIDCGCGMSSGFVRDQLFRAFVSSKPGGFGLGAYEARQLAQAMGGSLAVESREGDGTRFRLTLPAAPPLEAAA